MVDTIEKEGGSPVAHLDKLPNPDAELEWRTLLTELRDAWKADIGAEKVNRMTEFNQLPSFKAWCARKWEELHGKK